MFFPFWTILTILPKFVQVNYTSVKVGIFAKMIKILCNINVRADTTFYKKGAKFPKKFSDKVRSFSPGALRVGSPLHFWSLPLLIDDKQQKNKPKFGKSGTTFLM